MSGRKDPKQLQSSYQERRRAAALESQRNARKQATDRARKLALGAGDSEDSPQSSQQASTSALERPHLPPPPPPPPLPCCQPASATLQQRTCTLIRVQSAAG